MDSTRFARSPWSRASHASRGTRFPLLWVGPKGRCLEGHQDAGLPGLPLLPTPWKPVTAPSDADDTSWAYLAITPRV